MKQKNWKFVEFECLSGNSLSGTFTVDIAVLLPSKNLFHVETI